MIVLKGSVVCDKCKAVAEAGIPMPFEPFDLPLLPEGWSRLANIAGGRIVQKDFCPACAPSLGGT